MCLVQDPMREAHMPIRTQTPSALHCPTRHPCHAPQMVKGTSMAFPGFKKPADRADVVAYLNSID